MNTEDAKYHNIISDNIRKLRLANKYSQELLAEKLSCSREYVSRIENKKEKVSLSMLLRVADLFGISPSKLFIQH